MNNSLTALLEIEDGATVFESPQLTNENPFVYEKN
jgi:hypothetical protein